MLARAIFDLHMTTRVRNNCDKYLALGQTCQLQWSRGHRTDNPAVTTFIYHNRKHNVTSRRIEFFLLFVIFSTTRLDTAGPRGQALLSGGCRPNLCARNLYRRDKSLEINDFIYRLRSCDSTAILNILSTMHFCCYLKHLSTLIYNADIFFKNHGDQTFFVIWNNHHKCLG